MKEYIEKGIDKEEKALISFLRKTKQGKYAKIEESSLKYARVKEERETIDTSNDMLYYNIC